MVPWWTLIIAVVFGGVIGYFVGAFIMSSVFPLVMAVMNLGHSPTEEDKK